MSLEHNLHEESPGAFLSLASSLAPLVSREAEAQVETCLSLQQPMQNEGAVRQQAASCVQPSVCEGISSLSGLGVLAHVQEPRQHAFPCPSRQAATSSEPKPPGHDHNQRQCGRCHGKEPKDEYSTMDGAARHMLAHAHPSQTSEQCTPQYLQEKHATPSCPKGAGQYILAYAQTPHILGQHMSFLLNESDEKHRPEASSEKTSEELKPSEHEALYHEKASFTTEEQKLAPQKDLLDHQKASNLEGFLQQQQQKGSAFLGFSFQPNASSLHWIPEQQQIGHAVQPNSGSFHGKQKHSFVKPPEKQNLPPPQDEEKLLSEQGHKIAAAHGTHSSSLELDQQSLASLPAKQTAALYAEDQRCSISPCQVKIANSPLGYSKKHDSVNMHSHVLGSSLQECCGQQKTEPFQEFSPGQGSSQQNINQAQFLLPQQVFKVRPSPTVLPANGGVLYSDPIVMSGHFDQDGILNEREHPAPTQSPQGPLASSEQVYPAPLATHMAVLADERLFAKTLKTLNAALGLQVRVAKIGEIALNLHKLYKEVTCRGGLEMVTKEKKWNEVTNTFNFPASVSDVKNSYTDMLYHYEQVYFLRACGKVAIPATCVTQCRQEAASILKEDLIALEIEQSTTKGIINATQVPGGDPAASVGAMVTGAIDGKFENGYLVTVIVGAQKLSGVLYHVASTNTPPQNARVQVMMPDVLKLADSAPRVGRKRKKTLVYRKDPNAPRQNRTGYNFFFAEQRAKLKTMQPDKDRAISKKIGELWNRLSEDEKTPYQAKGVKDKERYVREMKDYKEKIQLQVIAPNYSKMVLSHSSSMHTPGSSSDYIMPSHHFSTCTSEASRIVSPQLPFGAQLPFAGSPEVSNNSHRASLLLDYDTWSVDRNPSVEAGQDTSADDVVSNTYFGALADQLPSACTVKALNDSKPVSVFLTPAKWSANQRSSVDTAPDSSTAVNSTNVGSKAVDTVNVGMAVGMLDSPAVKLTSDASTVNSMEYACTDRKDPKNADAQCTISAENKEQCQFHEV